MRERGDFIKERKWYQISFFIACCILINAAGKNLARQLELPLWLDAVGTFFAAFWAGPFCGAVTGIAVNIITGFTRPMAYVYGLTSACVGLIIGVCARKGMYRHLFGAMVAGFLATVASVAASTPLNRYFFHGNTNNKWGDGVIGLLQEWRVPSSLTYVVGEFYVDFLDKMLTTLLLFGAVRAVQRFKDRKNGGKEHDGKKSGRKKTAGLVAVVLAGALAALVCPAQQVQAKEERKEFLSLTQTIYNNTNGLPGGIANDIAKMENGILWIGSYSGLYRYSGSEFERPEEFDEIANVICLFTDEENRLWIGTNDNGLGLCINETLTNVIREEDGLPSNSVRCIAGGPKGLYYVGTADSLAVLSISSGVRMVDMIEEITYGESISVREDGTAAVVTNEGILYTIRDREVVSRRSCEEKGVSFTCCSFSEEGELYVGTSSNEIYVFHEEEGEMTEKKKLSCGLLVNIKEIDFDEEGEAFICADNGAGHLSPEDVYTKLNTGKFNSSIDHCIKDYQGNIWMTSSRLGLLRLCPSALTDIYGLTGLSEQVVNSTTEWRETFYFATDNGLDAANEETTSPVENQLTRVLRGIRVRALQADSRDRLWISTSGAGLWCVRDLDDIDVFNSSSGMPGDKWRTVLETSDGSIAAAGDMGLAFLDNGTVEETITSEQGLRIPRILCLAEISPGVILAGTDGNGIAVIENRKLKTHISREDGLTSEVILRLVQMEDGKDLIIVTGNGLCRMELKSGEITSLSNFHYKNNYDVAEHKGNLFILSSAGIYIVDKKQLFSGKEVEYALLDSNEGLNNILTPNSRNYMDEDYHLFISTDLGVIRLNLEEYENVDNPYRILLKKVEVDDVVYTAERGGSITIPRQSVRLKVTPEIVNFTPNDPLVSVYLEGFDEEQRIVRQSKLTDIVYTNLPSQKYTLYLKVYNAEGKIAASTKYIFEKEGEIYDNRWFLFYMAAVFWLFLLCIVCMIFRTQFQRQYKLHQRELALVNQQIQMNNEAIFAIAKTVDAKDKNTSLHSQRVAEYSVMIAEKLGFDREQQEELRRTALLHDIGKIGIPDRILNKPSRLTEEEYDVMKSHVVAGAEILRDFTSIKNVQEGALYHHERYDGKGYVHGLKGEEIPLNARIIGIADAFDAMTANRVYREKLDIAYVLGELERGKGSQFDPALVDVMLELVHSGRIDMEALYREVEEL